MVSLPRVSDISFRVVFSLPPRNRRVSQLPSTVSELSLYIALSWDMDCRMIEADISLDLIVAISFSKFGILPIFANSSQMHLTWIGSFPLYLLSALSHKRLNSCEYMIAARKLKVSSVSDMIIKSAVSLSPMRSSSISSYAVSSRSSAISKGASLAAQEIRIDFEVFPAANLYLAYCLTAKFFLSFSAASLNKRSTAFTASSSSSFTWL